MASYQREREEFIARVLAEGLRLDAAQILLRCATAINRYAELACSSEAADRDRVPCPGNPVQLTDDQRDRRLARLAKLYPAEDDRALVDRLNRSNGHRRSTGPCLCDLYQGQHQNIPRIRLQDWRVEQRAIKAVPADWTIITEGDPRGYTLRVIPPSYAERNAGKDRHNLRELYT